MHVRIARAHPVVHAWQWKPDTSVRAKKPGAHWHAMRGGTSTPTPANHAVPFPLTAMSTYLRAIPRGGGVHGALHTRQHAVGATYAAEAGAVGENSLYLRGRIRIRICPMGGAHGKRMSCIRMRIWQMRRACSEKAERRVRRRDVRIHTHSDTHMPNGRRAHMNA